MTFPKISFSLILAVCMALTACTKSATDSAAIIAPPSATATLTGSLTLIPTLTLSPRPTHPPFTPTYLSITEYVPTTTTFLESGEKLSALMAYLRSQQNCALPCWWGITPGISRWDQVSEIYAQFADHILISHERDLNLAYFDLAFVYLTINIETGERISHRIEIREGIVTSLSGHTGSIDRLPFSTFLSTYGSPDEIRLGTWHPAREGGETTGVAPIYLAYLSRGVITTYMLNTRVDSDYVELCLANAEQVGLVLWASDEYRPFSDLGKLRHSMISMPLEVYYPLLEDVAGISREEFIELAGNTETEGCFQTAREIWIGTD